MNDTPTPQPTATVVPHWASSGSFSTPTIRATEAISRYIYECQQSSPPKIVVRAVIAGIIENNPRGEEEVRTPLSQFLVDVAQEVNRANIKHGPISSLHAGDSILVEEVEEFRAWVHAQSAERDYAAMYHELVQVAAVALRIAVHQQLYKPNPLHRVQPIAEENTEQCKTES